MCFSKFNVFVAILARCSYTLVIEYCYCFLSSHTYRYSVSGERRPSLGAGARDGYPKSSESQMFRRALPRRVYHFTRILTLPLNHIHDVLV